MQEAMASADAIIVIWFGELRLFSVANVKLKSALSEALGAKAYISFKHVMVEDMCISM